MTTAARRAPCRNQILIALAIAAACVPADAVAAQSCFRGRPLPACRSYFITEAEGGLLLTLGGSGSPGGTGWRLGADVGWMRNLGGRSAIGATIAGGYYHGGDAFVSLRPRYRRWLSNTASLDVGPGVQWIPGRVERIEARAAFTYRDLVGAWAEVDVDWGHSEVDWLAGVKTGAYAGIASYLAAAITVTIYAIAFASAAD